MRGVLAAAAACAALAADPFAARSKGSATAPITVYEMGDFQCPACREFAVQTMPALDREYVQTGKMRLVFINYPLTSIHPNAVAAAAAALCAAQQDRFWPMHDILYRLQPAWEGLPDPTATFTGFADSIGVERGRFRACLRSGATRTEIDQDAARARRSGANSTPTFYIEGGLLRGAAPIAVFRQVLDSIYRVRGGAAPRG
jgi:protein-disulfide isomerase